MTDERSKPRLMLVSGPPRAGCSFLAGLLARHPLTRLLDNPSANLQWLKASLEGHPTDASGPSAGESYTHQLMVCPQLLLSTDLLKTLASSDLAASCTILVVDRNPPDGICSLARFIHLQPQLPDPWKERQDFFNAAAELWQQALQGIELAASLDLSMIRVQYEQLVRQPDATLEGIWRRIGMVGLDRETKPLFHSSISTSLCFRDRPVDLASIDRWRRQLSQTEYNSLAFVRDACETTPELPPLPTRSPLIATGRGGSGTRLLSEVLLAQGVHLGDQLNPSGDSVQWADILYEMALANLKGHSSPWSGSWRSELLHRARWLCKDLHPSQPWGFKLPEAMLVLHELLEAWPSAQIIHLIRHPLDTCLRRTHMTSRTTNPVGSAMLQVAYDKLGLTQDPQTDEPHWRNAVSWWYQLDLLQRTKHYFSNRILEIRYEDLCDSPQATADRLAKDLGLPGTVVSLDVEKDRRRRWELGDPRINAIWELCGSIAESYGYHLEA